MTRARSPRRGRTRRDPRRGGLRARLRSERGITAVEAAFVTPIFFIVILGICELSLAMNDYLGLANGVRAATRVASAAGSDSSADYLTLKGLASGSAALRQSQIQRIVIFKATAYGDTPSASCQNGTAYAGTGTGLTGACNVYSPSDLSRPASDFGCVSPTALDGFWCPSDRDTSLAGTGTDYIGVWVKYNHVWLTKMFGSTKSLTDVSVIRLEPRDE